MANYDLSKPAPDKRSLIDAGSPIGGIGLIILGTVIILTLLYLVFGTVGPADDRSVDQGAPGTVQTDATG
ncbi:hypothetical protein [Thalassorhabdomicrobium marinisediminis]|uniref:hypothetical protein n=1 Tax=Thalassorhabdomicrobium marinisediminis TaxID=2170577 RepID=UPI00248FCAB6|nr:hypothetical protein [Thalassorhabdomicrobium marinisediminis]